VRSSFSTIVSESYDLSCVVLDAEANSIAQGTMSVPIFIASAPVTARHMLDRFPPETLRPGDVIFTNDPWLGTGHLFDVTMMRPVFRDGRIVAYTMSITHLPDIGGIASVVGDRDLPRGLRFPICKAGEAGRSTRAPDRAGARQRARARAGGGRPHGERRLQRGRRPPGAGVHGRVRHRGSVPAVARHPRACRARDARAHPHDAEARHLPQPHRSRRAGRADPLPGAHRHRDDRVHLDFDGTGPCVRAGINVPFCYARAMSLYSIKTRTLPTIPNQRRMAVPITVEAPKGCILDAQPPFATGGRTPWAFRRR
jgi:N-methylhydantoinase B